MPQNELMLRLLLGGKIVGYEWHRVLDGAERMLVWYSTDMETWSYSGEQEIDHDSVELGVRVGEKVFFEGDRVKNIASAVPVEKGHEGTVVFSSASPVAVLWDGYDIPYRWGDEDMEIIGNIHEEAAQ